MGEGRRKRRHRTCGAPKSSRVVTVLKDLIAVETGRSPRRARSFIDHDTSRARDDDGLRGLAPTLPRLGRPIVPPTPPLGSTRRSCSTVWRGRRRDSGHRLQAAQDAPNTTFFHPGWYRRRPRGDEKLRLRGGTLRSTASPSPVAAPSANDTGPVAGVARKRRPSRSSIRRDLRACT